jgi:aldehyde dehydrogenase (NAD+)
LRVPAQAAARIGWRQRRSPTGGAANGIANDSKYGLHAVVLGTDLQRARRVASQIRAGRVVINNMTDDPQAPWGGFKYSGVGREYGQYGIEAFLETRAILG